MNNLSYTFTMLFIAYFNDNIKNMPYDESFVIVEKVFSHWRLTDSLYGSFERMSEYDSIDDYLKTYTQYIKNLISDIKN